MRVTIDGPLAGQRLGGITTYIRELCAALASQPDDLALTVLYARRAAPLPLAGSVRQRPALTPAHHRWEGITFGLEAAATRPDLLHSPDVVPPAVRASRSVITVHDLAFLYWPEILDRDGRRHYGQINQAVASADHIIAVSETTRRDLAALLAVPGERMTVVPEAAGPAFHPVPVAERPAALAAANARPAVRARVVGERGPYLLVVGTLEPRKNLPFLLRTYDRLVSAWPAAPGLVLAGRLGWLAEETLAVLATLAARDRVEWIDGPTTPELALLYAGALALAFPSRYEGFGLPALEAMACGTPVLATDGSALREQVAEAGWLLPLDDAAAWEEALRTISLDTGLRTRLAEAGRRRAAAYSWARTAAATRAVYQRVMQCPS
jgi:glycosyltransferase involved in cell wall biosynthesis